MPLTLTGRHGAPIALVVALTATVVSGAIAAAAGVPSAALTTPRLSARPPRVTASTSARWRFSLPPATTATCRIDRRPPRPCSSGAFGADLLAAGRHRFTLRLVPTVRGDSRRSAVVQTWRIVPSAWPAPVPAGPVSPAPTASTVAAAMPSVTGGFTAPAPDATGHDPVVIVHLPETTAQRPGPTAQVPETASQPEGPAAQVPESTPPSPDPTVRVADPIVSARTPPPSPEASRVAEAAGGTASGRRLLWGSYVVGSRYGLSGNPPWDMRGLDAFEADAGGKRVSILHLGQPWFVNGAPQPFYPVPLDAIRSRGAIPLIDWSSWDTINGGSETQPGFQLAGITRGDYDSMIRAWATGARAWGKPLFLRFDHEMNGRWFPWSEIRNGNSAGGFVSAWRHVHDIFASVGARNVTWVWSPNVAFDGSLPLAGLYPGDAYVDWVGIDGYNWGTNPIKPSPWVSFAQLIGPTYAATGALAPTKPVMIAEFGSSEDGGSKAAWITDALSGATVDSFPRIAALLWFNWAPEGVDWTIESSASARSAFATAIASPRFAGGEFGALPGSLIAPLP